MFAVAYEKASKFTRPLIVSTYTKGGVSNSGCGAYIVVNRDGWFITAGHNFRDFHIFQEDQKRIADYNKRKEDDPTFTKELDPNTLTNHSFWFGDDKLRLSQVYVNTELDFALGKLDGFRPEMVNEYPIFKNPYDLRPGSSLCRLGYPFNENLTEFDTNAQNFKIRKGVLPMSVLPNEGILTRFMNYGKTSDGYDRLYIETSTPGLKGQSGGPIFDAKGFVAGMQVGTMFLDLGFAPTIVNRNGERIVEHQFMNVGIGVHVDTIMKILDEKKVKYHKETDDQGFRIMD